MIIFNLQTFQVNVVMQTSAILSLVFMISCLINSALHLVTSKAFYHLIYLILILIFKNEDRLREALMFANACGALTVKGRGAIPALPTREAVHNAILHSVG